ncbi:prolyl oligopeptidase family serine peptidase [Salininema proteolyticum]|uniref:Prolyl oligopeptidase family serine peptidase n=1 Tax=Salininema proteolyticum TaxID=1607685 RepID=A0ABV8U4V8_9ACTN
MTRTAPYGTWDSPITAETAAASDGAPAFLGTVGDEVWYTAPRPDEGGRRALMRSHGGIAASVLPAPWNVRNRVHEYGGRPWHGVITDGDLSIVFTDFSDQRMYSYFPDDCSAEPRPLTPLSDVGEGLHWCEPLILPERGEVWAVLQEFTGPNPTDVRRVLAAVPADGSAAGDRSAVRELTGDSHRFVTGLRVSPGGDKALWITWDHPLMPWDGTEVHVADIVDGRFANVRTVAGGPEESIPQAEWDGDGALLLASDRGGWWNLHRLDLASGEAENLYPADEEFAGPLWTPGRTWFARLDSGRIAALHGIGPQRLGLLDPDTGELADVPGPWESWTGSIGVAGDTVYGVAGSSASASEVVAFDTAAMTADAVVPAGPPAVPSVFLSRPEQRVFTDPFGRDVHARLYPPTNPGFAGPEGEPPPYVVWVHGGPTGMSLPQLDYELNYFTSRGIGVAEVDYGGSTGYGREYRDRLRGQWGVVDIADCTAVAKALAAEGLADPGRIAIRGGSAGGWTSAVALTSDLAAGVFSCAVILYPILDLSDWSFDGTHDFESRYVESLIGDREKVPDRYRERSPASHPDKVSRPFVILQGLDDRICPPEQSEGFLRGVAGRGVPHAYLAFEGEQHGFRRAGTIVRAVEAEMALYAEVFGFDAAHLPPLDLRY